MVLDRDGRRVAFQEGGPLPGRRAEEAPTASFSGPDHAREYLRYWLSDAAAVRSLRALLHDVARGPRVAGMTDRQVLAALAERLTAGSLRVTEPAAAGPWLSVSQAFRRAAARAAAARPVPTGPVIPAPPPPVPAALPVLPALEEVQIEGARVLPELLQTLEQLEASLGTLELAGVSLEPTPSAVPAIRAGMTDAAAAVTAELDAL